MCESGRELWILSVYAKQGRTGLSRCSRQQLVANDFSILSSLARVLSVDVISADLE